MAAYFQHQKTPTDFTTALNHFTIDDLLVDFPNDDGEVVMNDAFFQNFTSNSADNSSFSGSEPHLSSNITSFSGAELCVPYDDLAELEWLSSFTEESFSSDDLHNLKLISAANKVPTTDTSSSDTTPRIIGSNRVNSPIFQTDVLVPGKVRSKRSRAAPCDWSSRLILLKSSSSTEINLQPKTMPSKTATADGSENSVRRCLHCGSDKTPQWRRGPMGPKTLCNACGVRYKSGRLVPEYRPAASPSFVPAKHSNSHRKVMELRRQMELRNSHQPFLNHNSNSDGCNTTDDYLIHSQMGPSFMHMI
ncbi:GATA transcription factor 12-like [Cynara cardunculus var. scolymus]|uniref:GATA transcription factor n=1 Tax=Cynara cardunculus var. scolymus TaxID=59895 RepID=A0A103YBC4_CYNCS|nr:GATA transcription factor 12-like [Cynara cardunculus var. scolymus]KVI05937.1 Transcription factor, GATA, plant [Cynara cardunculus var. scolymus]